MDGAHLVSLRDYVTQLGLLWDTGETSTETENFILSPLKVDWSSIEGLSERELEAAQAALIALRDHFPTLFRQVALQHPDSRILLARAEDGRTIKLRRIAIARIARSA